MSMLFTIIPFSFSPNVNSSKLAVIVGYLPKLSSGICCFEASVSSDIILIWKSPVEL